LRGKCGRRVTLTTHFHPDLRLRSSGATTLLLTCLEGEKSGNFLPFPHKQVVYFKQFDCSSCPKSTE
jgi:hypothetical protein